METNTSERRVSSDRGGAHLKPKPQNHRRMVRRILLLFAGVVCVGTLALGGFTYLYPGIHPGVHAGGVSLSFLDADEAAQKIKAECESAMYAQTLEIIVNGETFDISPKTVTDGLDSTKTAQEALDYTHTGGFFTRIGHVLRAMFTHPDLELAVKVNDEELTAQLETISQETHTAPIDPTWKVEGENLVIDAGTPGIDFQANAVATTLKKQLETLNFTPYEVDVTVLPQSPINLEQIKQDADTSAVNATVDKTDGKTILPAQDGVQVDLAQAQQIVSAQPNAQTYTIPITRTPAKVSAEQLSGVLFRDTLGTATTDFSSSGKSRANNVQLASSFINGLILNPGEEFSYNGTVGERTVARGFSTAGAYSAGKLVDEVGGGVCQPSSTLYMAVLRADLKVTERTNHGFTVSYTPLGEDATVSYGSLDFKFRNSTEYPIKILADSSGRKLRMTILGTNATGKTVQTEREVVATYTPETIEKKDATLAAGTKNVEQTATTGYKVHLYKVITENGQTTRVQANTSTYKKRDKIVVVGTKTAAATAPGTTAPAAAPSEPTSSDPE